MWSRLHNMVHNLIFFKLTILQFFLCDQIRYAHLVCPLLLSSRIWKKKKKILFLKCWYNVTQMYMVSSLWLHLPCGCGSQSGKPHGTPCVVTQSVWHKWLPPFGQLDICWKQKWKPNQREGEGAWPSTLFITNFSINSNSHALPSFLSCGT